MSTIKMRPKESNGVVTVKALIKHPMETGQRKDKKTGIQFQLISYKKCTVKLMVKK